MYQFNDVLKQRDDLWATYTRKEEYSPTQLDNHKRFVATYSLNKNVLEPTVSKYLVNNGYRVEYPDDKKFAVYLSHDVDDIYPTLKHTLLSTLTSLRRLDLNEFRRQAFWKLKDKKNSPYWNFQEIMDLEEEYGAQSSFYFLATGSDIKRFRYNIEDLGGELGRITDRGWEVGLHGGYYAYNNLEEISQEKKRLENVLGRKVIGYRNHYLRFGIPNSWEIIKKAGFEYDTTLGYPDMVGFRNGMCHPFRPFNLLTGMEINIIEIPMIIMDGTLFSHTRSYEEAWSVSKKLIDTVDSCHGVLTLNWHNYGFNCLFKSSWPRLYKKILTYCHEKEAWLTSGEKIWRHFY